MVIKVENPRQLKKFVSFPFSLYKDDSDWVRPGLGADLASFRKRVNPIVRNLEYQLYIFESEKGVLGRIAVFISKEYNRIHSQKAAFFGLFESGPDQEVANSLLAAAEDFARENRMETLIGPIDFTTNYTMGVLVQGFGRPTLMTGYNKPYYHELLEAAGYRKIMDLYAYLHHKEQGIPERLEEIVPLLRKRYPNVFIRSIRSSAKDLRALKDIFDASFKENWGFMPMSEEEIFHLARYIYKNGDPAMVYLAYDIDNPAGLLISLPDPEIKGRLRLSVLGVKPEYRGKGIETRLVVRFLQDAFYLKGYRSVEYSLVLENNEAMNRFIRKESGCEIDRVYRVYAKSLV